MIPSIHNETAGVKFRSHLEARWSLVFTALGITWTYEPRKILLPSGAYVPDFFLADRVWVEIKPLRGYPVARTTLRCAELAALTDQVACLFAGDFVEGFTAQSWPTQEVSDPQSVLFGLFACSGWAAACRQARLHRFDRQGARPHQKANAGEWRPPPTALGPSGDI